MAIFLDKIREDAYVLPFTGFIVKPNSGLYFVKNTVNAVVPIKKVQPSFKSAIKLESDAFRKI